MRVTKHHGLGNDFLVVFDDQPMPRLPFGVLANRWCDRKRGIGADGLLIGITRPTAPDVDLGMILHNADGSRAEMSGNGIRCLAQAWAMRQGMSDGQVRIATDAGLRVVTVRAVRVGEVEAEVSMGAVSEGAPPTRWAEIGSDPLRPVAHLSLGNPHTVVAVDDVTAVDLAVLGALVPDVNLEIVEPGPEPHGITMRVHERGAGITEACGTGACAAATAAARWGLATPLDGEIAVHMDGGDAKVRLGDDVVLIGPAVFIAAIDIGA